MVRRTKKLPQEIAPSTAVVEGARRPQRSGPLSLTKDIIKVMQPAARRFGFPDARIFADWSMIMDTWMTNSSIPVSIYRDKFSKEKTLLLLCSSSNALIIQHYHPQIIERINNYYGFSGIKKLRMKHGFLPVPPEPEKPRPPLPPEQEEVLVSKIENVENDALRKALHALGRAIMRA